jgi:diadenosine tetraphosphate (Ap4A) HIT family hydrolase
MCADVHLEVNQFSFKVVDFGSSIVRLPRNQYMPGWTIVVLRRHACELFELSRDEGLEFWTAVSDVARALDQIYRPVKINYGVFGNLSPHIHCHVVPRFLGEDPGRPLNMGAGEVLLTEAEYAERIELMRRALRA